MALFSKYWHSENRTPNPPQNLKDVKFYLERRGREAEKELDWVTMSDLNDPGGVAG